MKRNLHLIVAGAACVLGCPSSVDAVTNIFFKAAQTANVVTTNMTSTTISSGGYLFTYSLDNWWYPTISLGPGTPTGRPTSVVWPNGVQAQTLTAGPSGSLTTQVSANISIKRIDGNPFDLQAFTGKILGNTAAAGAAFEIMPQLNGQDAFANPLMYDATGYAGNSFSYVPALTGYDNYIINLWMDFALIGLTLVDASIPPALQMSMASSNYVQLNWQTNAGGYSLQQNTALNSSTWSATTNAVSINGTNYQVLVIVTNGASFFRLRL